MDDTTNKVNDGKTPLTDEELWFSAAAADSSHEFDAEAGYARFSEKVREASSKPRRRTGGLLYWTAAAAVLLLVAGMSYWQGGRQVRKDFSDIVVEAPAGSKTRMTLPDGTRVMLNAGSRLTYSQGFGMTDRALEFSGEGYFEVEKNEKLPFVISTRELDLTVLGTKFNFRDYPEDSEATVNLLEGKVALDNNLKYMETRYLLPSDRMVMDKKTGEMQIIRAQVEKSVRWTDNILTFDEMLLPDIVKELRRSYNVNIVIENPELASARFYGEFNQRTQNIYDVLDILSATGRLSYEEDADRTIRLE